MRAPDDSGGTSPAASAKSLTILAIDDDALVLMSTSAMIEDMGHAVIEATSARDALAALEGGAQVDLVVTDQAMPGMTGVELAQAIRARWPDVPVVLATGYSDLPPGSPPFPMLGKPFSEKDLANAIARAAPAR